MIKHIVMWKLAEVAEGNDCEENARRIKRELEALTTQIDGIIRMEVGKNLSTSSNGYDLALYSEFVSVDALTAYSNHPAYQKVREFVRKVITARAIVDYAID